MLSKIVKISLIVLGVPVLFFVGLVIYEMTIGLEKPPQEVVTPEPPSSEPVAKKVESPKQVPLPSLPSTSEPVIVSVNFPKQVPLNQKTTATVNFKDREGDVAKLIFQDLNSGTTNEIDYSSKVAGRTSGSLTFGQIPTAQISIRRLILIDKAGNQSAPYILIFQAGDTHYYDRFEAEVLRARPVERRKKIHFFILSNAEFKTELGSGSGFLSEEDSIGTASPAVIKMFEASVLPQINGLWDQCGVAFDLGMVKAVRPEKVNLPNDGGTLVSIFGTYLDTGEPFTINTSSGETETQRGTDLIRRALPLFSVPNGDIAIFIVGPKLLNVNTEEGHGGLGGKNIALVPWRYIHFQNETSGEIIIPKLLMKIFAHEIGHALGLDHPGEGKAVPEDKFSEFNLMRQGKLRSELIPEQCGIVAGRF